MQLHGVFVPVVTPFTVDNQVDTHKLRTIVQRYIASGVSGLVACGTTGEYYALSESEREQVLKTIAQEAKGKVVLMAGISDLNSTVAHERAQQAKQLGYECLMLSAPAYALPTQDGIVQHVEYVASATDLPIVLYNFPARVGVNIEFETVQTLAQHPLVIGIKESSGNFSQALRLIQYGFKDFDVICGCDDQPLDYFFWGVKCWISGSGNVFPKEQVALYQAAQEQNWDYAKAIMTTMYPALLSMESSHYNQKAKVGCLKGVVDAGLVRLPLTQLSPEEKQAFLSLLK